MANLFYGVLYDPISLKIVSAFVPNDDAQLYDGSLLRPGLRLAVGLIAHGMDVETSRGLVRTATGREIADDVTALLSRR